MQPPPKVYLPLTHRPGVSAQSRPTCGTYTTDTDARAQPGDPPPSFPARASGFCSSNSRSTHGHCLFLLFHGGRVFHMESLMRALGS